MHKLTSNQSVVYNAETQDSSILTIEIDHLNYESFDSNHTTLITGTVKASNTNVGGVFYQLNKNDWNTFFAAQTLTSTTEYDKQLEAGLYYIKSQLDGNWGLTTSDWIYSNS